MFVGSASSFFGRITWYNGNTVDTTVLATVSYRQLFYQFAGGEGQGTAANQLSYPLGIFLDRSGNVYVADAENNRVQKFPMGSYFGINGTTVAGGNGPGPAANQLSGPDAIFVDAIGNLYVADTYNGRIQEFPPGSTSTTKGVTIAGGNGVGSAANQFEPTGVYLDASGNLYVTDYSNNRILEFPPGSTSATNGIIIGGGNGAGSAANQLSGPYCGIVDGNGNLFVADQGNQRVQKFPAGSTSATNAITVAGGNGPGAGSNQLLDPSAVFLDRNGDLFVDDMENNRVQEFPPGSTSATNGVTVAYGGIGSDAPSIFIGSYGLFVDSIGDIFFSNAIISTISEKFKPASTIDTIYVPTVPGTYTAVVTDVAGCSDTTNAITILPIPPASLSISANSTAECTGDTLVFTASAENAGPTPAFQWQVNGKNTGANSDTLIIASLQDNDVVNCILTSYSPCYVSISSQNSIPMTIYPRPVVTFIPDTIVIKGGTASLLSPIVDGATGTFWWTPSTGLNNPDILSPVADPVGTTTYQLTVTTNNGCQASGKETVVVYYPLAMPNAFTPNGDGKNDVFRLPPSLSIEIKRFAVYDRGGMRVFETTNSGVGWDGTFDGHPQPPGTYVWEIQYEDAVTRKSIRASGSVILIR